MHYHFEVHIPEPDDGKEPTTDYIEEAVEAALAPHGDGRLWDWYQIGGRWTGEKDGYKPEDDPANVESCDLCGGTGFRRDEIGEKVRAETPSYTCNGCGTADWKVTPPTWTHGPHGPGKRVKWATDWKMRAGDVVPVSEISDELNCHTLIVDGYGALPSEGYDPLAGRAEPGDKDDYAKMFPKTEFGRIGGKVKEALRRLGVDDGYVVTVDCHN
jgi:hypothetical protein